jgi:hypothetical protein
MAFMTSVRQGRVNRRIRKLETEIYLRPSLDILEEFEDVTGYERKHPCVQVGLGLQRGNFDIPQN